jgi:hypothetical protein
MTERERGFPGFWISAVHAVRFLLSGRCVYPMELRRPGGGREREERGGGGGGGDVEMRAGSAGTSNISGAWTAAPPSGRYVRPMKFRSPGGGREGGGRWRSMEEGRRRRAGESGESWDFEYCWGNGPRFIRSDRCLCPMELRRPPGGWEREEQGGGGADEQMGAGSVGISNMSRAWAAVPSVGWICVANEIQRSRGRMGGRRAWRWRSVEEEMRKGADESGECWDFGYGRCMCRGSFGQTGVSGRWN